MGVESLKDFWMCFCDSTSFNECPFLSDSLSLSSKFMKMKLESDEIGTWLKLSINEKKTRTSYFRNGERDEIIFERLDSLLEMNR